MFVPTLGKNDHSISRKKMKRYVSANRDYIVIANEKRQKEEQRARLTGER